MVPNTLDGYTNQALSGSTQSVDLPREPHGGLQGSNEFICK